MKLKKIASLALAGVLAVSMLAGCAGKTGTGSNTVVVPSNTSAVTAVNDGQDASNKVKVTFTSSTALENALKTVIADNGDATSSVSDDVLKAAIKTATGEAYGDTVWGASETGADTTGSKKQVVLYVGKVDSALTDEAAVKMLAGKVNGTVKTLAETTYNDDETSGTAVDTAYYNYSYEGEVALVSATTTKGVTTWYYAYTIEQTAKAVKLSK